MTLFEGLAGTGPDIDAFFQIEDEINQSALDMGDGSSEYNLPGTHNAEEMITPAPAPVSSPPPAPEPVNTRERRPSSGHLSPRAVNISSPTAESVYNRRRSGLFAIDTQTPGQGVHPSPLAQIYQPLVFVDDESNGEENQPTSLGSSFVPRRRVASMTRPRRPSIEPFQPYTPPQPQPHPHPARPGGPPPAEHMAMPIPPSTVQERDESAPLVTSPGEISELTKRLMAMEERQQRIENLLVAMAGELRTTGNRGPKTNA